MQSAQKIASFCNVYVEYYHDLLLNKVRCTVLLINRISLDIFVWKRYQFHLVLLKAPGERVNL